MRQDEDFRSNLSEFFCIFLHVHSLLFFKQLRDVETTPCLLILGTEIIARGVASRFEMRKNVPN